MKSTAIILMIFAISLGTSISAKADVYVRGYHRSNGTYVQPHRRSNPDGNVQNNWSTYPNVNPYTGATGTTNAPSPSGRPSFRTPRYDGSSPNLWNSRSPSVPSLSKSDYNVYGYSRHKR